MIPNNPFLLIGLLGLVAELVYFASARSRNQRAQQRVMAGAMQHAIGDIEQRVMAQVGGQYTKQQCTNIATAILVISVSYKVNLNEALTDHRVFARLLSGAIEAMTANGDLPRRN